MTNSSTPPVNLWREAVLDRLAVLCLDAPQDEPPESILRRIIEAEVAIALDPRVSDAAPPAAPAPAAPVPDGMAPNADEVICPNCAHQFRAIPENVQSLLLASGHEPPFAASPAAPVVREPLPTKQIEVVIYDHTKLNPNQADDRELIGRIVNAIRAIEAAYGITGGGNG